MVILFFRLISSSSSDSDDQEEFFQEEKGWLKKGRSTHDIEDDEIDSFDDDELDDDNLLAVEKEAARLRKKHKKTEVEGESLLIVFKVFLTSTTLHRTGRTAVESARQRKIQTSFWSRDRERRTTAFGIAVGFTAYTGSVESVGKLHR